MVRMKFNVEEIKTCFELAEGSNDTKKQKPLKMADNADTNMGSKRTSFTGSCLDSRL